MTRLFLLAFLLCATWPPAQIKAALLERPASSLPLAHPPVVGSAGPYSRVTVTLRRTSNEPSASFTGIIVTPNGRSIALSGPDEPSDFFLFDVRAVLFASVDRKGRNGIVILYDRSQIGPRNGTQRKALVYSLGTGGARRLPSVEQQFAGAGSAAEARRRLRTLTKRQSHVPGARRA